jgi:hypothetical protein
MSEMASILVASLYVLLGISKVVFNLKLKLPVMM